MKKVIHSLEDIFQILDPKVENLKKNKQLITVENSSNMSAGLYARWKKGNSSPYFSTLLVFMQNLGVEMSLNDGITVDVVQDDQIAADVAQDDEIAADVAHLVNQFLTSATLRDKYLIRDLLIRLMSEDS